MADAGTRDAPVVTIALAPTGRVAMRRDMELVREILLSVQARTDAEYRPLGTIEGYDDAMLVFRHAELLIHAGLLEGKITPGGRSALIKDMSWDGHDFIGVLKQKSVWAKIKQKFTPDELATVPLSVLKNIATKIMEDLLKSQVGL